jgi:hypothetical protein
MPTETEDLFTNSRLMELSTMSMWWKIYKQIFNRYLKLVQKIKTRDQETWNDASGSIVYKYKLWGVRGETEDELWLTPQPWGKHVADGDPSPSLAIYLLTVKKLKTHVNVCINFCYHVWTHINRLKWYQTQNWIQQLTSEGIVDPSYADALLFLLIGVKGKMFPLLCPTATSWPIRLRAWSCCGSSIW